MISTQTMLLNKEAFWAAGGFDETLQSYEDYEFSIRFAREYRIGYAADTSVKVYDYENSVNKRWAEQIRTQIYILRKWYDEFLGRGLLLYTICQIQLEGYVGGHMLFAMNELKKEEKIRAIMELPECQNLLQEMLTDETKADNDIKIQAAEALPDIREKMRILYQNLERGDIPTDDSKSLILDVMEWLREFSESIRPGWRQEILPAEGETIDGRERCMDAVSRVWKLCDLLMEYIQTHKFRCNVCGSEVFFVSHVQKKQMQICRGIYVRSARHRMQRES